MPGNRLPLFARRAAPLQISWAGYVGTTGLANMDALLVDRYHVPEGWEDHHREKVIRFPDWYMSYAAPYYAPDVSELPAKSKGYITFGSFNNPAKIDDEILKNWQEILQAVPNSKLVLLYTGMTDPMNRDRILGAFTSEGIDAGRIELNGRTPHVQVLEKYGVIDIALDTQIYSGGLTTCEALWMGVPVVTLPGTTFMQRHSLSHLSNAGLPNLVAKNAQNYIEIAVDLANDLLKLAELRSTLRERVKKSPLCDGEEFTRNFERLIYEFWQNS
jgi:predicted O-linked N-acetylglucosamine transferase (SPINDLY family)